jgi:hypothetical protein
MTERTKTIKGLISGQVDMGTFGLVEIELLAIENDNEALRKHAVSSSLPDYVNYLQERLTNWNIAFNDFETWKERQ